MLSDKSMAVAICSARFTLNITLPIYIENCKKKFAPSQKKKKKDPHSPTFLKNILRLFSNICEFETIQFSQSEVVLHSSASICIEKSGLRNGGYMR